MKKIGIIGGGASGALVALHCWKQFGIQCKITIFDPSPSLGIGKAYSTENTNYLLNIPVQNMHIFSDQSNDFETWIIQNHPQLLGSTHWPFVQRFYFSQYLHSYLSKISEKNLIHIQQNVVQVSIIKNSYCLTLQNMNKYHVDHLVVATGYQTQDSTLPFQTTKKINSQIYTAQNLKKMTHTDFNGHVLIIGTGLTAIDIWRQLRENQSLKFTLLSRHGFLPLARTSQNTKIKLPCFYGMSPLQIFQILRFTQKSASLQWSEIADQLQIQAQKIWTCWTQKEKSTFLKYLRPYWEVIRHQMPDSVAQELDNNLKIQQTYLMSGHIQSIQECDKSITVQYHDCQSKNLKKLSCNHLIFAIGSKIENSLIHENIIFGAQMCPYGFGYLNHTAPRLWFVGPAAKGMYYEITSIPYIRTQAEMIANHISQTSDKIQSLKFERLCVHPKAAKETYFQHLKQAMSFARTLFQLAWFALIHALLPFLYTDQVSEALRDLAAITSKRRLRTTHNIKNFNEPSSPVHPNHAVSLNHQNHQQTYH